MSTLALELINILTGQKGIPEMEALKTYESCAK
jgi:hypothetical protein